MNRSVGIDAKLARAREQLAQFEVEVEEFNKATPAGIIRANDPVSGRIQLFFEVPPYPLRWPILVGEVVHNLRSALDHLIWDIFIHETGAPPSKPAATQFPIFKKEADFRAKPAVRYTEGLSDAALAFVESCQPFKGEFGNPLWHLHELSNWDKHRTIHLMKTRTAALDVAVNTDDFVRVAFRPPVIIEDRFVFFDAHAKPHPEFPMAEWVAKVNIVMDTDPGAFIAFKTPDVLCGKAFLSELQECADFVSAIVERAYAELEDRVVAPTPET